jgi:tetratricopeptide (TPR) repeat protein
VLFTSPFSPVCWFLPKVVTDLAGSWPRAKFAVAAAAAVLCVVYAALAWQQTTYWQNPETLYLHAIKVTGVNSYAEGDLGFYLMNLPERRADAIEHLEAALRINPYDPAANKNLGEALIKADLCPAAIPHFEAAIRANPQMAQAHNNLGVCIFKSGTCEGMIPHFDAAIRASPDLPSPRGNLGSCLVTMGRYADALPYLETALRLNPDFANARFDFGKALEKIPGREHEAVEQYEALLSMKPDYVDVQRQPGLLLLRMGRKEEAISHLETAQNLNSDPEIAQTIDHLRAGQK